MSWDNYSFKWVADKRKNKKNLKLDKTNWLKRMKTYNCNYHNNNNNNNNNNNKARTSSSNGI